MFWGVPISPDPPCGSLMTFSTLLAEGTPQEKGIEYHVRKYFKVFFEVIDCFGDERARLHSDLEISLDDGLVSSLFNLASYSELSLRMRPPFSAIPSYIRA